MYREAALVSVRKFWFLDLRSRLGKPVGHLLPLLNHSLPLHELHGLLKVLLIGRRNKKFENGLLFVDGTVKRKVIFAVQMRRQKPAALPNDPRLVVCAVVLHKSQYARRAKLPQAQQAAAQSHCTKPCFALA